MGNNIKCHKPEEAKDEEQKQEQECKTPECPNIPQSQIERADMRKPEGEQCRDEHKYLNIRKCWASDMLGLE